MPQETAATSEKNLVSNSLTASHHASQYGSVHHEPNGLHRVRSAGSSTGGSTGALSVRRDSTDVDALDADKLDERLRGLNHLTSKGSSSKGRKHPAPGQRIADYENALAPPTPKQALGFKVIRRPGEPGGTLLTDIPNEILAHILSHLHPDCHGAVALVSKRFYVLATTPHIWRLAFLRYFPGHTSLDEKILKASADLWSEPSSDVVRLETRYFGRLTPLATWRSEYVFRTRLLRSVVRGRPNMNGGGIGSSVRASQLGKKSSAVLTYNSKLPWTVSNVHAVFDNGRKPPRALQGCSTLGVATMSDPTTGKIEHWGLKDPHSCSQIDEVVPGLSPYGIEDGPAATDNVMDVSQNYGMLSGEGFPGGRPYFRDINEIVGRYLGSEPDNAELPPDIPKIPRVTEAISSVWIAKSSAVPATTQSMCGMFAGSTLGVVTAYSLGSDPNGPRFVHGDMTARWVLSPGVPIVSIKVDESYSVKRRLSSRVWAAALNALGEVYYLTETPKPITQQSQAGSVVSNAWYAGRTAYWHLVEATRRTALPDELGMNAITGTYSPRTPSNVMRLTPHQIAAEAREIETFMRHQPSHFRKVCAGWDMRRRLEVDFAHDDGRGAGEGIFVIDCGHGQHTRVTRYSRFFITDKPSKVVSEAATPRTPPSVFGRGVEMTPEPQSPRSPPPTPSTPKAQSAPLDEWRPLEYDLKDHQSTILTASAMDNSAFSLLTLAEDPLHTANETIATSGMDGERDIKEIPGRRARFLVVGTQTGAVVAWNARERHSSKSVRPSRIIQTESPEISCVAASSLYLVHGGSDGLVQAWDPLASVSEPIRTVNARSNGRVPRHMLAMNPTLDAANYTAVGAIFLDSDPTVLRGIVAFGAFMRYWSYSSKGHAPGRKRRLRHHDGQSRLAGRRFGSNVSGCILEEEAELRHENEQRAREQTRLRNRFGVGALGDLTEQEAMDYAQMISEETFHADEQRRASDSAADTGLDSASSTSGYTPDATTPEASFVESSPHLRNLTTDDEGEYEEQIQQAIRLSLLEGVNDRGQSPRRSSSSDEFDYAIRYKPKPGKRSKRGNSSSPPTMHASMAAAGGSSSQQQQPEQKLAAAPDDADLALALSLSMQPADSPSSSPHGTPAAAGLAIIQDDFPPLDSEGVGKGKGARRWS